MCDSTYIKFPKKGKFIEKESRTLVAWGRRYELGLTVNGHEGSSQGDENVLKLIYGEGVTI